MEEQGAATQEITRNVQQAAQGTEQVTHNISGVREGAGQTSEAATQVLSAAQELSRHSEGLTQESGLPEQYQGCLSRIGSEAGLPQGRREG